MRQKLGCGPPHARRGRHGARSAARSHRAARMSAQAESLKSEGNDAFAKGKLDAAIAAYTEAICLSPDVPTYYTNRAMCYRKKEVWGSVIDDCSSALRLDELSIKGHYLKGVALDAQSKFGEAVPHLTRALDLCKERTVSYKEDILRATLSCRRASPDRARARTATFTQQPSHSDPTPSPPPSPSPSPRAHPAQVARVGGGSACRRFTAAADGVSDAAARRVSLPERARGPRRRVGRASRRRRVAPEPRVAAGGAHGGHLPGRCDATAQVDEGARQGEHRVTIRVTTA